jgi:hypothetical protein
LAVAAANFLAASAAPATTAAAASLDAEMAGAMVAGERSRMLASMVGDVVGGVGERCGVDVHC